MRRPRAHRLRPVLESLEGRVVLSHAAPPAGMVAARINLADGSGAPAILAALNGGAGSEFVTLIRRGVPNVNAVLRQFVLGTRTELQVKGFAVKTPHFQPQYAGPKLDQFNPTAAGAVLLKDGRLELGAILRGPIDRPEPVTYSWGMDRGSGAADPEGLGVPGARYDAVVRVTRSGQDLGASITDLKTGAVTPLASSAVQIQGPTIRVFLTNPAGLLPSTGKPLAKYSFFFSTRSGPGGPATVGGFVPSTHSIPIGVLGPIRRGR